MLTRPKSPKKSTDSKSKPKTAPDKVNTLLDDNKENIELKPKKKRKVPQDERAYHPKRDPNKAKKSKHQHENILAMRAKQNTTV